MDGSGAEGGSGMLVSDGYPRVEGHEGGTEMGVMVEWKWHEGGMRTAGPGGGREQGVMGISRWWVVGLGVQVLVRRCR